MDNAIYLQILNKEQINIKKSAFVLI